MLLGSITVTRHVANTLFGGKMLRQGFSINPNANIPLRSFHHWLHVPLERNQIRISHNIGDFKTTKCCQLGPSFFKTVGPYSHHHGPKWQMKIDFPQPSLPYSTNEPHWLRCLRQSNPGAEFRDSAVAGLEDNGPFPPCPSSCIS